MTVFAPSNAAFARANADGWVGNLASLQHLLLRHIVRWENPMSLVNDFELTLLKQILDTLTRGNLPAFSFPSGVSQVDTASGEKVY